jgi:hypothetical protein
MPAMKATHRRDILTFSAFDRARNLDFNGWLLVRDEGNILVDPVEMSDHDIAHARELGGVAWIVVTNSDHIRAASSLAATFGAEVAAPAAEREGWTGPCARWLRAGDDAWPGIEVLELEGSKTPGELAFVVDGDTLITGDLVRAHRGGGLNLLPDAKLRDKTAALASLRALADRPALRAVLVGDGWPIFEDAPRHLRRLLDEAGT